MKEITEQVVEALRQKILGSYALVCSSEDMMKQVHGKDFREMTMRLSKACKTMDRYRNGMRLGDAKIRELVDELHLLRSYFGAPTGRPLEPEGVRFVEPYLTCLERLFETDRNPILYVEMLRTSLVLLEYQLPLEIDSTTALQQMLRNLSEMDRLDESKEIRDAERVKLTAYLMELHKLLAPYLQDDGSTRTKLISMYYLRMSAAMSIFEGMLTSIPEDLVDAVIVSVLLTARRGIQLELEALLVMAAVEWIWDCELEEKDRAILARVFAMAQEVCGNA